MLKGKSTDFALAAHTLSKYVYDFDCELNSSLCYLLFFHSK